MEAGYGTRPLGAYSWPVVGLRGRVSYPAYIRAPWRAIIKRGEEKQGDSSGSDETLRRLQVVKKWPEGGFSFFFFGDVGYTDEV